eukprot:GILJ01010848.1.p1 GENE.GILJ01010848.1~~GILJ01010848.1.p1  ORF type:complete len:674 (+),score=100.46 GILJ01010848.1:78-2099(+)
MDWNPLGSSSTVAFESPVAKQKGSTSQAHAENIALHSATRQRMTINSPVVLFKRGDDSLPQSPVATPPDSPSSSPRLTTADLITEDASLQPRTAPHQNASSSSGSLWSRMFGNTSGAGDAPSTTNTTKSPSAAPHAQRSPVSLSVQGTSLDASSVGVMDRYHILSQRIESSQSTEELRVCLRELTAIFDDNLGLRKALGNVEQIVGLLRKKRSHSPNIWREEISSQYMKLLLAMRRSELSPTKPVASTSLTMSPSTVPNRGPLLHQRFAVATVQVSADASEFQTSIQSDSPPVVQQNDKSVILSSSHSPSPSKSKTDSEAVTVVHNDQVSKPPSSPLIASALAVSAVEKAVTPPVTTAVDANGSFSPNTERELRVLEAKFSESSQLLGRSVEETRERLRARGDLLHMSDLDMSTQRLNSALNLSSSQNNKFMAETIHTRPQIPKSTSSHAAFSLPATTNFSVGPRVNQRVTSECRHHPPGNGFRICYDCQIERQCPDYWLDHQCNELCRRAAYILFMRGRELVDQAVGNQLPHRPSSVDISSARQPLTALQSSVNGQGKQTSTSIGTTQSRYFPRTSTHTGTHTGTHASTATSNARTPSAATSRLLEPFLTDTFSENGSVNLEDEDDQFTSESILDFDALEDACPELELDSYHVCDRICELTNNPTASRRVVR